MTTKPLALLALAVLVAACSSGRLPDPPEADRSRGFQAAPEVVRTAARAHFEAEGFRPATAPEGAEAWERPATGSGAMLGPATERVTVTTAPGEGGEGTHLVLLLRYTRADGAQVSVTPLLTRMEYTRHLDGISARVPAGR